MIGGSLPPTKREATTTQFISAGHRDALAILCKPHNEYGLSNAAKLADKMWSLVSKVPLPSLRAHIHTYVTYVHAYARTHTRILIDALFRIRKVVS